MEVALPGLGLCSLLNYQPDVLALSTAIHLLSNVRNIRIRREILPAKAGCFAEAATGPEDEGP